MKVYNKQLEKKNKFLEKNLSALSSNFQNSLNSFTIPKKSFEFSKDSNKPKEKINKTIPTIKKGKWTQEEDMELTKLISHYGPTNWCVIAQYMNGRNRVQCLQRWTRFLKPGLKKGHWTSEEDHKLKIWVKNHGPNSWSQCAKQILEGRSAKQCRERWYNCLDPSIKIGEWTEKEDFLIYDLFKKFGTKWSKISEMLPGRTENSVKNRFYSAVRKAAAEKEKEKEIIKEIEEKNSVASSHTNNNKRNLHDILKIEKVDLVEKTFNNINEKKILKKRKKYERKNIILNQSMINLALPKKEEDLKNSNESFEDIMISEKKEENPFKMESSPKRLENDFPKKDFFSWDEISNVEKDFNFENNDFLLNDEFNLYKDMDLGDLKDCAMSICNNIDFFPEAFQNEFNLNNKSIEFDKNIFIEKKQDLEELDKYMDLNEPDLSNKNLKLSSTKSTKSTDSNLKCKLFSLEKAAQKAINFHEKCTYFFIIYSIENLTSLLKINSFNEEDEIIEEKEELEKLGNQLKSLEFMIDKIKEQINTLEEEL